jgi:hypothetical protein
VCLPASFITYEDEAAVDRVFAKGRMHELAGKSVEVKRATPKGSGPAFGRGIPMQRQAPRLLTLAPMGKRHATHDGMRNQNIFSTMQHLTL